MKRVANVKVDVVFRTADGWLVGLIGPAGAHMVHTSGDSSVVRSGASETVWRIRQKSPLLRVHCGLEQGKQVSLSAFIPLLFATFQFRELLTFLYRTVSRNPRLLIGRGKRNILPPVASEYVDIKSLVSDKPVLIVVTHTTDILGAEQLLLNICRTVKRLYTCDLLILTLNGGELEPQFRECATWFYSLKNHDIEMVLSAARSLRVRGALCNTVVTGDIACRLALESFRTIQLIHELPGVIRSQKSEDRFDRSYRYSTAVVFPSEIVKTKDLQARSLVDDGHIHLIPQGLYKKMTPIPSGEARQLIRSMGVVCDDSTPIVIGVGDTTYRKGFDLFAKMAHHSDSSIAWIWVGKVYDSYVAETAANRVTLVGAVEDITPFYSAASALLLTSREDPFPSVVLESLSLGVPVFAFEGAGGAEQLLKENGMAHCVVPFERIDLMEQAVMTMIHSETMRDDIWVRGPELIRTAFSYDRYVQRLWSLLEGGDNEN